MIEELLRKKPGIVEVIEPGEISDAVVAQVTSGQSGQVILPKKFSYLSGLRGYPSWFQEKARAASANVLVRDMDYKRMD
jgi:all-trans-retinol dehydrogenase (NAD+)